jgi:hypothetical protein
MAPSSYIPTELQLTSYCNSYHCPLTGLQAATDSQLTATGYNLMSGCIECTSPNNVFCCCIFIESLPCSQATVAFQPINILYSVSLVLSEVLPNIPFSETHISTIKKKLHGLSPRANYTDLATAACRRSDCQLLRIEGATWSAWRIPTAVFSVF